MTTAQTIFYIGLIFTIASITSTHAVNIKKFTVPSTYVLNQEKSKPLILDCEYDITRNETGLVLKWLLNGNSIYVWILNHRPYGMSSMKKHLDTTFSPSSKKYDEYRAIYIVNPQWNMTGNYTCSIQTFEGISQQTAELIVIHPETKFTLHADEDEEGDDLEITCSVEDIYPPPNLSILINGQQLSTEQTAEKDKKGPFDVVAKSKKPIKEIESPATITCILTIPGTDYEKRQETVFTEPENVEMIDDEHIADSSEVFGRMETSSELDSYNGNDNLKSHSLIIFGITTLCLAVLYS